jgi:hypothetical protein
MKNHTGSTPFEYVKPAPLNVRLILLEADGKVSLGPWKGPHVGSNDRLIGWAALPARDLAIERKLAELR